MEKFEAFVQDIPGLGKTVTVLDESRDVFFHVEPGRVQELIEALSKMHVYYSRVEQENGRKPCAYCGGSEEAVQHL